VPQQPIGFCHNLNDLSHYESGEFDQKLNESNFSYRGVLDYKFDSGTMVFGSVSRGYKGGVITNIAASTASQVLPARQERVDAYELGIKTPLWGTRSFLNLSGFYYNYKDKQVRARILDPLWGLQERLVTVPKSRIWGFDADLSLRPIDHLTITASGTYLNTEINGDFSTFVGKTVFDQAGQSGNFKGSYLPYAPKFTGNLDAEYEWPINSHFDAYFGGSVSYRSRDNVAFQLMGKPRLEANDLPSYGLLDLRAGVTSGDDRWRVEFFGRNVTNKYYLIARFEGTDENHRYAGMPATYGVRVELRR
jgi:iron complex outermembrane receptor protein